MKAWQKTQLNKFFWFLDVRPGEKLLFITCPGKEASLQEVNREREFLVEARAFFGEEIKTCPVDEVPYIWDDERFDLILLRYVLFHCKDHPLDEKKCLGVLGRHLSETGRLVVVENNRIGLKTLAGDRYDGTGKDAALTRSELLDAFTYAGLFCKLYYPYPLTENINYIFTDAGLAFFGKPSPAVLEGVPRAMLFDEGEAARLAAKEGAYGPLANQFLCIGQKRPHKELPALVFRQYFDKRKEAFRLTKSLYEAVGTGQQDNKHTKLSVWESIGEAASAHLKEVQSNCLRLDSLYKGYTLQIADCRYEKNRLLFERPSGRSLSELLSDTLERELLDEVLRLVGQLSDILTTPARLSILDGEKRGAAFSDDTAFAEMFGSLSEEEEALLKDEIILPLSLPALSFDFIYTDGRRWTLLGYEWLVDFPVPFSYILYSAITEFCRGEAVRRYEARILFSEDEEKEPGFLRAKMLGRFDITAQKALIFERMKGCFEKYISGDTKSDEAVLSQCISDGTLLPVEEVMSAFVDGEGSIPIDKAEAFEEVPGGFFEKLIAKLKSWKSG